MQHGSIDDPASYRLHKLGVWNTIEVAAEIRIHDLSNWKMPWSGPW